jgi:predicted HTH transcriptional regulator
MDTKPTTNATGLPSREQMVEAAERAAAMPPASTPPPVVVPVTPVSKVPAKPSLFRRLMTIVQFRKQQRKERMVMLAEELKSITTEDVRRRIRITKVTARKYLEELVREGRLHRRGKKGSYVYEVVPTQE